MEKNNSNDVDAIKGPPYNDGILAVLKWSIENNTPLQNLPHEKNWCGSGYKCYYGGVIPGNFQAKEAANNFVISGMNNVTVPENPNKPISTKLNTEQFFIILSDIRDDKNIKIYFFFYDGIETLKNIRKNKASISEFSIDQIGEYRKPWQKIEIDKIKYIEQEMHNMFEEFVEKVKLQQSQYVKQHSHDDNCECGKENSAEESSRNNATGD